MKAHRNFPFDNVNVVDGDVTQLPLGSNLFDMAVSFSSFPNFSDKPKAIKEINRVLKSGSQLHIIQLLSSKEVADRHRMLGGVIKSDELPSVEEMTNMLSEGGFDNIAIDDHPGLYLASATVVK